MMVIDKFIRESANFQLKRDRGMGINAEDLDFEFNNIVNYINSTIVLNVNNLKNKELIGLIDPNLKNSCIQNVGDGTTKWNKFDSNNLDDDSIELNKFNSIGINPGLLFFHNNKQLKTILPIIDNNSDNKILFSQNNLLPIFRKVNTGDIENNSLTNDKIGFGAINYDHFNDELKEKFRSPEIIFEYVNNPIPLFEGKHFYGITNDKINPFFLQILGNDSNPIKKSLKEYREKYILNNTYIQTTYDRYGSYDIKILYDEVAANLDKNPQNIYRFFPPQTFKTIHFDPLYKMDLAFFAKRHIVNVNKLGIKEIIKGKYTFISDQIKTNSVTHNWFKKLHFLDVNRVLANGSIKTQHLAHNQLCYVKIKNHKQIGFITKESLDPIIRQKLGI